METRQLARVAICVPFPGVGNNRVKASAVYQVNFVVLDGPASVLACEHRRMQAYWKAPVRTEDLLGAPSWEEEKARADAEGSLTTHLSSISLDLKRTQGRNTDDTLIKLGSN